MEKNKMFDKIKNFIHEKQKEREEEERRIEESNKAYYAEIEKNRAMVESRQKEASKNIRCPLCQGDKFFYNIQIAFSNHGEAQPTYVSIAEEEGMHAKGKNFDTLPLNTFVCKKCGNIIQKINFSHLEDFSFRDSKRDYTLIQPVQWNE